MEARQQARSAAAWLMFSVGFSAFNLAAFIAQPDSALPPVLAIFFIVFSTLRAWQLVDALLRHRENIARQHSTNP